MEHKVSGRTVVNLEPRQVRDLNDEELALFSWDATTICKTIQSSLLAWGKADTIATVERLVSNMAVYTVIEDTRDCVVICESNTHTLHIVVSEHGKKATVPTYYTEKASAFAGESEGHSYIFILDVKKVTDHTVPRRAFATPVKHDVVFKGLVALEEIREYVLSCKAIEPLFGTTYQFRSEKEVVGTYLKFFTSTTDLTALNESMLEYIRIWFAEVELPTQYPVLAHAVYHEEVDRVTTQYLVDGDIMVKGRLYDPLIPSPPASPKEPTFQISKENYK